MKREVDFLKEERYLGVENNLSATAKALKITIFTFESTFA